MQQPTGQFVYINGGAGLHQPMLQNVAATPQQRQQYVVVMPAPMQIATPSGAYANYKRGASKAMGAMQIVMAIILIGLNIGIAAVDYNRMWLISSGWWAAPFIIIAGAFGIGAGSSPSHCTVVTTMVMSIFSCLCVVSVLVQGALGIAIGCDYYYYYGCYYDNETPHIIMSSFFILFGLGEFVFALIQSILCCQGCCNKPTIQANQIGPVQNGYTNGGFVPCYVHPQVQAQSTFVQPATQAFQLPQQGGATGQNTPMPTAQNVGMATAQAGGATGEAPTVQPPPYSKGQETGY